MDHRQVGKYWNENAEAWTRLSRAGFDTYRDFLNTPAFLEMLPLVGGLSGLDIGCGEGHNTRLLASRGARLTGLDVAGVFLRHAAGQERAAPLGIGYIHGSAVELPFPNAHFDFATGFMSFMDIPETEKVAAEAFRVLKPGGFLQFSITHPSYDTPHRRNLRDETGRTYAYEVGGYFQRLEGRVEEWIFSAAPAEVKAGLPKFKVPRFTRTLSEWINLLVESGFQIERLGEPCPTDEAVAACPNVQDSQVLPNFLILRLRKPG